MSKAAGGKHGSKQKVVLPEDVEAVRAQLTEEELQQCDDAMISRYIRATWSHGAPDIKHVSLGRATAPDGLGCQEYGESGQQTCPLPSLQAVKRIRDTLAWWAKEHPHEMVCTACRSNPKSHYMVSPGEGGRCWGAYPRAPTSRRPVAVLWERPTTPICSLLQNWLLARLSNEGRPTFLHSELPFLTYQAPASLQHVVGHDLADRPVIYSCLELATNRNIEDNRKHMISTFEQVGRLACCGGTAAERVEPNRCICAGEVRDTAFVVFGFPA